MKAATAHQNPMTEIRLEKITLNMGAGESGPKLEKAKKILETITGRTPIITKTKERTTFGTPKSKPIGVAVTMRGREAKDLLKRLFKAVDNMIKISSFDSSGNFSFGVGEYINIPGIRYDPDVGIIGLDVCVTLERPGFSVKRRALRPGRIGRSHMIKPGEAAEWVKKEFGIALEGQ